MSVGPEVIDRLIKLERELAEHGREDDAAAVGSAVASLTRPPQGWLTTGQAAARLGAARQTIKNWIGPGTLRGMNTGTRWLVSPESVEAIEGLRRTFAEAAAETYPSPEDIQRLTRHTRRAVKSGTDAA